MKKNIFFIILLIGRYYCDSQSLEGITGCVNIPTAIIPSDGSVLLGVSYWSQLDQPTYPKKNATAYYADMAYFPWCEVVYRRTMSKDERLGDYSDHDRMASIKVRCFRQSKYSPSIAFGINDIFTASGSGNLYYYSCYGVVSKELKLSSFAFLPTLGYGFSINKRKSYLDAWFGGIDVSMEKFKNFHLLMDYDTHQFNLGIRQKLFDRIYIIGAYHIKSGISFGVVYQIHLI